MEIIELAEEAGSTEPRQSVIEPCQPSFAYTISNASNESMKL